MATSNVNPDITERLALQSLLKTTARLYPTFKAAMNDFHKVVV
jgi:hypothetical protein